MSSSSKMASLKSKLRFKKDEPVIRPKKHVTKKIVVGVCAMRKKSESKPMKEILLRLQRFEYLETRIFDEEVILNEPVERWPICDALVSFFSSGFPLSKAIQYAELRKPFLVNDLKHQYHLMDRTIVYNMLNQHGIPHPRYIVVSKDDVAAVGSLELMEADDQMEVRGEVFSKPFVEKPVDAENHNIHIYFPSSAGGGSQRLFRKIGNKSSEYIQESRIRNDRSYIYEDFIQTDGTDVKVYTLGPDYAHAEARKSPALDGRVERDENGKEVRYPVILSAQEKLIARKVCLAFQQSVCGFDLLRTGGISYVCDVNGFSFVKNSKKYYDDCGKILGNMIMRALAPQNCIPWSIMAQPEDIPIVPTTYGQMMELRCVVAVIRHGDRTPKQKMKMEVKHKKFFELFERNGGYKTGHLKLKKPRELQEVLDLARELLTELQTKPDPELEMKRGKIEQLKTVLEMYGYFSGINRKVQLKYQPNGRPRRASSDDAAEPELEEQEGPHEPSLVLIVKWGGELTPAGRVQAEELGRAFRCLYPGGQGNYAGTEGLGLLRLHSTFRHDLKIYASDEGRVQMTAAAFAKGLLALDGDLTPILVQMVKSAHTNGLLDNDSECIDMQNKVKERLREIFHQDRDFTPEDYEKLCPTKDKSVVESMRFVKNPYRMCQHVWQLIQRLVLHIRGVIAETPPSEEVLLYHEESWDLLVRRWSKLEKDFRTDGGNFDISKIPDIYDCAKFDLQHNQRTLQCDLLEEMYTCSRHLANVIIPQEYGMTNGEKLSIGKSICTPLLRKIRADFHSAVSSNLEDTTTRLDTRYARDVASPQRFVRTRLYFTSESHIHSLINILKYGEMMPVDEEQWTRAMHYISAVPELNYITQIVVMLYEDIKQPEDSNERFHCELHFSSGAYGCKTKTYRFNFPQGAGYRSRQRDMDEKSEEGRSRSNSQSSKTGRSVKSEREASPQRPADPADKPEKDPTIIQVTEHEQDGETYDYELSLDDAEARDIKKLASTWMGTRSKKGEELFERLKKGGRLNINVPPPWSCGTGTVYSPPVVSEPPTCVSSPDQSPNTAAADATAGWDSPGKDSASDTAAEPEAPQPKRPDRLSSPPRLGVSGHHGERMYKSDSEQDQSCDNSPSKDLSSARSSTSKGEEGGRVSETFVVTPVIDVSPPGTAHQHDDWEAGSRSMIEPGSLKVFHNYTRSNSVPSVPAMTEAQMASLEPQPAIEEELEIASSLDHRRSFEEWPAEVRMRGENRSQSFEDLSAMSEKRRRDRYSSEQFQRSFRALFGPNFKFPPQGETPEEPNNQADPLGLSKLSDNLKDLTLEEFCHDVETEKGGSVGVPSIRPLETLHNALTLKEIDEFLERNTAESGARASSPHRRLPPGTPLAEERPLLPQTTSKGASGSGGQNAKA